MFSSEWREIEAERIKKNIDTLWVDMVTEQETFHPPPFRFFHR
jgi:hypothetical protein